MAGIPPLAGFWGKLYIFIAAVEAEALCAGGAGRAGLGRGVLLLPAHRQGDVFRRAGRSARPAGLQRRPRRGASSRPSWWRCSPWRRSRSAWWPPPRRRACSREFGARPAGRVDAGRVAQRRQHQRRGRAPGRRRRARRHGRLVARTDRRQGSPRPPLGVAGRQPLHLDDPAARLSRPARRRAGLRRGPGRCRHRPAGREVRREMAQRRAGRRRQDRRHPARERRSARPARCSTSWPASASMWASRPSCRRCAIPASAPRWLGRDRPGEASRQPWRRGSPNGAATASRSCVRRGSPRPGRSAPKSTSSWATDLVRGRFAGLDREGALLLETASGPRKIVSGELLGRAA